ncbi:hypothetical protein [Calothrix sp. NIES-2098]|uniref:hypothetical protein n=1 Tax=Calothrix sp. NIES-2098 TaxID=1954171 RepID=UPI000B5E36D7|nr:hypothetical protein NIES2098_15320 [Calothrix sp. NIES-2098]
MAVATSRQSRRNLLSAGKPDASYFNGGNLTPVRSSRETLSAIAHGGNPQDRIASPRDWLRNALALQRTASSSRRNLWLDPFWENHQDLTVDAGILLPLG